MSKILITSIGNGRWNESNQRYEYAEVEYTIGEKKEKSAYIFDALNKLRGYDKFIFVGTAGSGWDLLYEYICDTKNLTVDFDYVDELSKLRKSSDKMKLDIASVDERLKKLKEAFGDSLVDIIVLKYGLNDDEHITNFGLLTKIAEHIKDGDNLTFDITHSFRSLAFYELLTINYIRQTLGRKVTLDFVSYGMEISRENQGSTPIVDLSRLIKMIDWQKAAEEYQRNGTTALLLELMNTDNIGVILSKEEKKILRRLGGDAISVNDLNEFKNLVKNCRNTTRTDSGRQKHIAFDFIFRDIANRFEDKLDDDMYLQMELAKWHFEKKRYISAAITLVEATLDYCAKLAHLPKEDVRKKILYIKGNSEIGDFKKRYDNVRKLRNKLAHAKKLSDEEVRQLGESIKEFHATYKQRFKDMSENEGELKRAFANAQSSASGDDIDS